MEDSLDVERRTLGHGMARLAQLNWHEKDTDSDSKERFTVAMLTTSSTPNICSMSNPSPISWQDVEVASAKDEMILHPEQTHHSWHPRQEGPLARGTDRVLPPP